MNKGPLLILIAFCTCLLIAFVACEHQLGEANQQGLQPTFSSIQANILTQKCVNRGCHPGGGAPASLSLRAGVAFGNLVNVPSAFENGNLLRVSPNDADNSALYLKVLGAARTFDRMPRTGGFLSQNEIAAIRDWIDSGAPNN